MLLLILIILLIMIIKQCSHLLADLTMGPMVKSHSCGNWRESWGQTGMGRLPWTVAAGLLLTLVLDDLPADAARRQKRCRPTSAEKTHLTPTPLTFAPQRAMDKPETTKAADGPLTRTSPAVQAAEGRQHGVRCVPGGKRAGELARDQLHRRAPPGILRHA